MDDGCWTNSTWPDMTVSDFKGPGKNNGTILRLLGHLLYCIEGHIYGYATLNAPCR